MDRAKQTLWGTGGISSPLWKGRLRPGWGGGGELKQEGVCWGFGRGGREGAFARGRDEAFCEGGGLAEPLLGEGGGGGR